MIEAIAKLRDLLGPNCITDPSIADAYLTDWRGRLHGRAACVLRPSTSELVSKSVAICREAALTIVPQGGNTGLVGGATPDGSGCQVVISTSGMKAIRKIDPIDLSIVAEAGVTIEALQAAASAAKALFPLSFAAEGTATLGGALATNAGGIAAVRYGCARDLVLGLEVVLPDGQIWNGLRTLRKDNTGYALKHLFLGSEGTLGLITAAAIKLMPSASLREVAFCAIESEEKVLELWMNLRAVADGHVRAIEYLSGSCIALAKKEMGLRCPVEQANHYALIELTSSRPDVRLNEALEAFLANMLEDGTIIDAALAQSGEQQKQFWRLREDQTGIQKRAGYDVKHDVAVPVGQVAALLRRSRAEIASRFPDAEFVPFGHIGDGNIHANVVLPSSLGAQELTQASKQINEIIYEIAVSLGGIFSAEHGIGQAKIDLLERRRSSVELDLMRRIKDALDEDGLFNPGKVFRRSSVRQSSAGS